MRPRRALSGQSGWWIRPRRGSGSRRPRSEPSTSSRPSASERHASDYSQPPAAALDFAEPYLRTIFGFVGITDIHFFNVQPMDISQESRREAFRSAISEVRSWVDNGAWDGLPDLATDEIPADLNPQVILD